VGAARARAGQSDRPIGRHLHLVTLVDESAAQRRGDAGVVFDNENLGLGGHFAA
jgi:hypothetical protein